jgi:hypothetical protein
MDVQDGVWDGLASSGWRDAFVFEGWGRRDSVVASVILFGGRLARYTVINGSFDVYRG